MLYVGILVLMYIGTVHSKLWSKGVVHFTINAKDYDPHSQEIITSALQKLEKELCVKFFVLPHNYTSLNVGSRPEKIAFVTNPSKIKECPPLDFNFNSTVVDIPIGYKCLNERDVANVFASMLKATFKANNHLDSLDLLKEFQPKATPPTDFLLEDTDRNLINTYYFNECGALHQPLVPSAKRRSEDDDDEQPTSPLLFNYYANSTWPMGVVMYTVVPSLRGTHDHTLLKQAMTTIELGSCVVFQFVDLAGDAVLDPKNVLIYDETGDDVPGYGFVEGRQTLQLSAMVHGCRGHSAHALNTLFRVLGIPMTSNRYDRDNFIRINWKNVVKGKEHLLEKVPEMAFVHYIPYEFESVTHAPGNFMCQNCDLGAVTVEPIQDLLWQRTLMMGHRTILSNSDIQMLRLVYGRECARRHGQPEDKGPSGGYRSFDTQKYANKGDHKATPGQMVYNHASLNKGLIFSPGNKKEPANYQDLVFPPPRR